MAACIPRNAMAQPPKRQPAQKGRGQNTTVSFINLNCLQHLPGQLNLKAKLNLPPEQQYRAHNCVCKEARQYNRVAEHCTMQPDNSGSCHDTIGPSEEPDRQTTRALKSQRPGGSI